MTISNVANRTYLGSLTVLAEVYLVARNVVTVTAGIWLYNYLFG